MVLSPVMPYPALGGGHKRTLRLIEAIERAGGLPHVLTDDPGLPGGADELRRRGWTVELVEEREPTLPSRARQHLRRLPSPYLTRIEARHYYKPGQFLVNPNDNRINQNEFESSARLEVFRPPAPK